MAQLVDNNVLFCIPDISGFTKFVAQTEIGHSQHIVRELLEGLIDANNTGLQVSEIEGDAVLFYRLGAPPSLPELVEQARECSSLSTPCSSGMSCTTFANVAPAPARTGSR